MPEHRNLQILHMEDWRSLEIDVDAIAIMLRPAIALERQPLNSLFRSIVARVSRAMVRESEHEVRHRHDCRAGLEWIAVATEKDVRRDEPAMTPAHDAHALRVDVWHRREIVDRGKNVVDLLSTVVDLFHPLIAVAGAATIIRREDDVPALHRLDDERVHAR